MPVIISGRWGPTPPTAPGTAEGPRRSSAPATSRGGGGRDGPTPQRRAQVNLYQAGLERWNQLTVASLLPLDAGKERVGFEVVCAWFATRATHGASCPRADPRRVSYDSGVVSGMPASPVAVCLQLRGRVAVPLKRAPSRVAGFLSSSWVIRLLETSVIPAGNCTGPSRTRR